MGSISRGNAIDKFVDHFDERISKHFESALVGATIESLNEVRANYYVQGTVQVSNGESFPVHHRWTSQEEDSAGVELDEDFVKMEDYYAEYLIGKTILSVRLGGGDRDDEAYLYAHVSDNHCLEIPLGFDPEHGTLDESGLASQVISLEEFKAVFPNGYSE